MDRRQFVVGSAAAAARSPQAPRTRRSLSVAPVTLINPFPPGGAVDVVGRRLPPCSSRSSSSRS